MWPPAIRYTVLILKTAGALCSPGLDIIHCLYRKPSCSPADLFAAPQESCWQSGSHVKSKQSSANAELAWVVQEEVDNYRTALCQKLKRSSGSSFGALLTGVKIGSED